jgi:hypothetical protein
MKAKLLVIGNFIFFLLTSFLIYEEIQKTQILNQKIINIKKEIESIKLDLNSVLVQISLYKNPEYLKKILLKNYLMNNKEFIVIIKMY